MEMLRKRPQRPWKMGEVAGFGGETAHRPRGLIGRRDASGSCGEIGHRTSLEARSPPTRRGVSSGYGSTPVVVPDHHTVMQHAATATLMPGHADGKCQWRLAMSAKRTALINPIFVINISSIFGRKDVWQNSGRANPVLRKSPPEAHQRP